MLGGCGLAHPPLETGRRGQPETEEGNHSPKEASSTKLQAGFLVNQDSLRFWTVDVAGRVAARDQLPRGDIGAPEKVHLLYTQKTERLGPGGDK